ncbi:hypothetical protein BP6252_01840 [Coleophoma cylindrospora]|uniref:Alpha-L-rhamnosidase C-terminal domain-containing protein n=1 Tax=Coleophoma cylindrospora TaxID=1849047 RepID=A0A3D8SD41_9HELO|nr:hypothetical protein BP6252_01840 [Coleophoma cylindrospora]
MIFGPLTLLAACFMRVVSAGPWPSIPLQQPYSSPTGAAYLYPTSIANTLTDAYINGSAGDPIVFTTVGQTYTLDYGRDVAGYPVFEVAVVEGYAQIEVKYSEAYNGLLESQGDGPFAFANGLAGTFRVETFNLTHTGNVSSYFIQGSQRWQSITLIKGSYLKLSSVGFKSSVEQTPLDSWGGYFASSNTTYTDIWALGPYTQQLVCFAPGTQTSTWEITENGAYIRGQKPATTAQVVNLKNYTLSFETMVEYGGTGWRVDTEIDAIQATGPIFVLTSEYPDGSFANIDQSLVPPNTLVVGRGWSLQNQTSLPGYILDKFPVLFNVTEKVWHTIKTTSPGDNTYTVLLDDLEIAHFNISSYGVGDPNPYIPGGTYKSFAFGPWQDQAAYVRNANVVLSTGETVYSNPMTSDDVLVEYGVQTNEMYTCSDSGKRDRFSWLGDRLISARAVMAGTGDARFVWGPAEEAFSRQVSSGQIPINTLFSPLDTKGTLIRTTNLDPLLVDYNFDFMQVIFNYWMSSGNNTFLQYYWPKMVSATSYAISRSLDLDTQLYGALSAPQNVPLGSEKGQALGPASTISLILGLERMAIMASYLKDNGTANAYRKQAELSRIAIDTLLWNSTDRYYASSVGITGYDVMDIAQVLLGEVGTVERRAQFLEKLASLKVAAGYINGTRYEDTPRVVNPYYMSFLLEGLAKFGETELAQDLLDRTWSPMVRKDRNYTGAYWEYVSIDGVYPGLDIFTGQSHFWGSYPTVFLTDYVLGIRALKPAFNEFLFAPLPGFRTEWVHGRVPTPSGSIYAAWGYNSDGKVVLEINAPDGLVCVFVPPFNGSFSYGKEVGVTQNATIISKNSTITIVED